MRGEATGRLEYVLKLDVAIEGSRVLLGSLIDKTMQASEPIVVPHDTDQQQRLFEIVEACQGAETYEKTSFFRKRKIQFCPALSSRRVADRQVRAFAKDCIRREIV